MTFRRNLTPPLDEALQAALRSADPRFERLIRVAGSRAAGARETDHRLEDTCTLARGTSAGLGQLFVAEHESARLAARRHDPDVAWRTPTTFRMLDRCREAHGQVFVAEDEGTIIGFVTVLAHLPFTDADDPAGTYAVVTDLAVLPGHRGRGTGRRLLDRAMAFAHAGGARELRVEVLARNEGAIRLYLAAAFVPYLATLVKRW